MVVDGCLSGAPATSRAAGRQRILLAPTRRCSATPTVRASQLPEGRVPGSH
jgi:hypothetical protein